jgi:hypothetical protein
MKSIINKSLCFWGIIVACLILSNFLHGAAVAEENYKSQGYSDKEHILISPPKETQVEQKENAAGDEPPAEFTGGFFTVGDRGIVEIEWLYDGGRYEGELGVFSLSGMASFTPGSPEFVKEAARRALSNTEDGYIVFSDPAERARFSGALDGETKDWNAGPYKGLRRLGMRPGDRFAAILIPDDSIENVFKDPGTAAAHKRPLFSLIASNPAQGMYLGQVADVNGLGRAFVYEDMDASHSDLDYNDFIFQVFGATVNDIPSLDDIARTGSRKRNRSTWFDWRTQTALGKEMMAHVESPAVSDETLWLSVETDASADLSLADAEGREIGKAGGYIPGALWSLEENGHQFVSLLPSESGKYDYRVVLRGAKAETCSLTVKTHRGYSEILSQETKEIEMKAYQIVNADISGEAFSDWMLTISESKAFFYDFDADGDVDHADIQKVSSCWNTSEGDPGYDPLYDLDGDGAITVKDIMRVSAGKSER